MKHILMYFMGSILIAFLFSCKQKPVEVITMNNTRPIEELKQLVLMKGDTVAYNELITAFMNEKHEEENLIYSIIMAHRYNYPRAYFETYRYLIQILESYGKTTNEKTKEMAIKYLKKAVELKDCSALGTLSELYKEGKYVPKDTIMSRKLAEESKKLCGY